MEILAILFMLAAVTLIAVGVKGIVQASLLARTEEGEAGGGAEAHRLRELAERRAMLVQLIRGVELDRDTGKIDDDEAARRIANFERQAVRVAKEIDELVGDDEARDEARAELETFLEENRGREISSDWDWSDVALERHGGRLVQQGADDS